MNQANVRISVMSLGWKEIPKPWEASPSSLSMKTFRAWFQEVRDAGYDGVSGFLEMEFQPFISKPEELVQLLAEYELSLASVFMNVSIEDTDYITEVCDFMQSTDCRHLVLSGFKGKEEETDFLKTAENWNRIGNIASQRGIDVAYHHHTNCTGETMEDMDKLITLIDLGKVGLMLDTGHAALDFVNQPMDQRQVQYLEKYGDRISYIEFKDWSEDFKLNTLLGEGECNFPAVFNRLYEISYNGWITVEFNGTSSGRTAKEQAALSREFIRNKMGV